MKIESTGYEDSRRIVNEDRKVIAMCTLHKSGFWAVHDADSNLKIGPAIFKTPRAAMWWFSEQEAKT